MGKDAGSLEVRRAVERGSIPPVWLWAGPEDYLKDELFRILAAKLVDEAMASLNVNRFRGGDDGIDAILIACQTLPMFSARRAIHLRDVDGLNRGDRDRLLAYVARPCPETALVLSADANLRDSFCQRLVNAGAEPAIFWIPFESDTRKWIQIRFRDLGKRCDDATAQALIDLCGAGAGERVSLREIAPEIEKTAMAVGSRDTITEDDLGVIGRRADENLLYAISGSAAARDLSGALRALDGALLFRDNTEVRIIANLTHLLQDVARARDLVDSGLRTGEVRAALKMWEKRWALVEAALPKFTRDALGRGLLALAGADRTLKSTGKNSRVVVEEALVAICGSNP